METKRKTVHDTAYTSVEVLFEYESLASLADPDDVSVSVMSVVRQRTIMLKVEGLGY
jgi:hypothetical protein